PSDASTDGGVDAGPVVVSYACPSSSDEVVFVSENAPPATLTPWQHFDASVTFANCGSETWSPKPASGTRASPVRLGPSTPHDSRMWTRSRLELPADVPPGNAVTIAIPVHAPPLTGSHPYAYELVREGVAWLGHASPMHAIDVEAAMLSPIAICPSAGSDPSGRADTTAQIQACIDATPSGGTLALPAGIYRVSGVLTIDKPMTLTTAGATGPSCLDWASAPCAVLRADASTVPSASGTRGFLRLGTLATATSNVTLDHVVVDGNRVERLAGTAATNCAAGQNGDGINVGSNCASCALKAFVSTRAVCGSGFEHDGDGLVIDDSDFFGNGDHGTQNMWSDGLTIHKSDASHVTSSRFVDNSDVGFISGGGVNAVYTGNTAQQLVQSSFAAMMLDNFDNAALGDFTGATLDGNTVYCGAACHFGIELGPHPWYASPNIKGASVTNNSVIGANIEINAQGAGVAGSPVVISGNTLGATPASAAFQCGNVSGLSPLNVSAESVVDLKGGAATGSISVPCP
ncbi:MAG TPA: glycosyl hydrolase family 28-related protein, partial [Labilithrix sp.]